LRIENPSLWEEEDPCIYAKKHFEKLKQADKDWISNLIQAKDAYNLSPSSVRRMGVWSISLDYVMDMVLRPVLADGSRIDHLALTDEDIEIGNAFRSKRGLRLREPFQTFDSLICALGGTKHDRDTLERTRLSLRVIGGNLLAPADYSYEVVGVNFMEGAYSNELRTFVESMINMLRYLDLGGFFAVTVMLQPKDYVASNGIVIPMPGMITEGFLKELFDQLPVKYTIYTTKASDIRPGGHDGVALIAGRKIKQI
jgi:hypothetical protein